MDQKSNQKSNKKTKKRKKIKNTFDVFNARGKELTHIHRWNGWFAMLLSLLYIAEKYNNAAYVVLTNIVGTAQDIIYQYADEKEENVAFNFDEKPPTYHSVTYELHLYGLRLGRIPWLDKDFNNKDDYINHFDKKDYLTLIIEICISEFVYAVQTKKDVEVIILPVSFQDVDETSGSHSNYILYRPALNRVEWFEPHGSCYMRELNNPQTIFLHHLFERLVSEMNKNEILRLQQTKPIEFVSADALCPFEDGFQSLECYSDLPDVNDGYCNLWGQLYIYIVLHYPDTPGEKIFEKVFKGIKKNASTYNYFRHVAEGFTDFLNEKILKHHNVTLDELVDDTFTSAAKTSVKRELLRTLNKLQNHEHEHGKLLLSEATSSSSIYTDKSSTPLPLHLPNPLSNPLPDPSVKPLKKRKKKTSASSTRKKRNNQKK